jgi:hypothetical protein
MRQYLFYIPAFLSSVYLKAQSTIDTALLKEAEQYKVELTGFSACNTKPSFGPITTLEVSRGEKTKEKLGKEKSLSGSRGMFGLMKTVDRKETQPITILALYNTDTVTITMQMVTLSSNTHEVIQFGKNEQPDENSSITFPDSISIRFTKDTIPWMIARLPDAQNPLQTERGRDRMDINDEPRLKSTTGSFEIESVSGFPVKGKTRKATWLWNTSGFVFLSHGRQVAAVELNPELLTWFDKSLHEEDKKILYAAVLSVISSRTYRH